MSNTRVRSGENKPRPFSGGTESTILLISAVIAALAWLSLEVAREIRAGELQAFDEAILLGLRQPDNPSVPRGPAWLPEAMWDLTALGSQTTLALAIILSAGFLLMTRRFAETLLLLAASIGGAVLTVSLKALIGRERPSMVMPLLEVRDPSFPSGHSMLASVVYLTLGVLLCRAMKERSTRLYLFNAALLVALLVGVSRVYLGVHYPSDVLAGWAVGTAWALGCWLATVYLQRGGAGRSERDSPAERVSA